MNVLACNGSPRKTWNTAKLLEKALEGAASQGATTHLLHLYDLHYTGCTSCFACKLKEGKSYGACAVQDDLTGLLARIQQADVLILGSPIYFGDMTGEMRSFLERLLFPYLVYADPPDTLFGRKIRTALIYTMNAPEETARLLQYPRMFESNERYLRLVFGHATSLMCYDTLQFADYAKMVAPRFDADAKRQRHQEVFPADCSKAYALGVELAGG